MTTDNNVTYLKQLSNDDAMRYIREMDDWIRVALSLNNKTDDDGESNFIMVITVIRVEG